ncbi:MAG: hypothetical protein HC925_03645 [Coleofasciculaceae cyanobacterium SM2_3_26]|nr:hypothetical protein [Coleofasciculaceae cyanobacterium SM2_3_26]
MELIAGRTAALVVKLPAPATRLYVKLWVRDLQSRQVLEGPYILQGFIPNGLGSDIITVELTVPYGIVEIRFEAIAVEAHTHRESYKVTLDRTVQPPAPPTLPEF